MVEIPVAVPPQPNAPAPRARARRILLSATALVAVLGLSAGGLWLSIEAAPRVTADSAVPAEAETQTASLAPEQDQAALGEPAAVELPPVDPESVDALRSAMRDAAEPSSAGQFAAVPDQPAAQEPPVSDSPSVADAAPAGPVQTVPLPVARPPQFRSPVASDLSGRGRQSRRARVTEAAPAPVEDTRSFFDRFFGVQQPAQGTAQGTAPAPALAYASLETPAIKTPPPAAVAPAPTPPAASGGTATYDISARIVTLPNGERLEAHSGLGEYMDNPRYVHVQMRGATPPGTYDLTEREAPFHGVRALRMTPVGGSAAIYGRAGLLAHTYMLRAQPGASNGCVVFRNYDRFLQAYLNGEIRRLVVVAGSAGGSPLDFVKRLTGQSARLGSDG